MAAQVIWKVDRLPFGAYSVTACPSPFGGALVLSPNLIVYATQSNVIGLALNGYYDDADAVKFPVTRVRRAAGPACGCVWLHRAAVRS